MLLNRIVKWVLNNRVLLALQDFVVAPVLKRLPAKRYESVRYKKNILFKMCGISAGTLTHHHLAKNNVDLSLRYACEIVSNQGYMFYSQNWKTYLLYVGLIHAHKRNYDQASMWLAEGFAKQNSRTLNAVSAQSYPDVFVEWLANNMDVMTTADGWKMLFADSRNNEKDFELLLIYISICIFALQLTELIVAFFDTCEIKNHSDWKKMIVYRQSSLRHPLVGRELTNGEVWHGSYPDTGQKLAANMLQKTFSRAASGDLQNDKDFHALAKMHDYEHVTHKLFPAIMNACNFLVQSKYSEARDLLESTVEGNSDYLSSISSRIGPTKLFLAGFGWSGSSAVHDAFRGYPHTKDMPGAGELPALNVGADSEPMLHQGAGGLGELVQDIKSNSHFSDAVLQRFFKNQVLLMAPFDYLEYKTVNATKNIIGHMGIDDYYLLVCAFLHDYATAMSNSLDVTLAVDAVESFQENIVNTMYSDDDIVFFNNSIFAHCARILNHVRGRSYYIVVNRQMSDQFCDQMRSNKNFDATFLEFYLVKLNRIFAYKWAKATSRNENLEFIDIMFESWIQDPSLRENIARRVCGSYDKEIESKYFDADKSGKNINISKEHMGSFDRMCLNIFEKTGLSI
ncbi:MAG: hypothetical protein DRR42_15310 [Gammaproteobacteria bacterium]|nr:MAG: hypothetical protein DRR42_15310 [Gammaproteobacteria bacterium]